MTPEQDQNTIIVLHANRVKGLFIVAIITLICIFLANWSATHTRIFLPFILLFWTSMAFIASYAIARNFPYLFFYELIISNIPFIPDNKTKIKKQVLTPEAIDHYYILSGFRKRFGYAIRVTKNTENRVFFIVPKFLGHLSETQNKHKKIGDYYQKPKKFHRDFDMVKKFLESRCKKQRVPSDSGIRFLYILPVILFFMLLIYCISFPIYIIMSL